MISYRAATSISWQEWLACCVILLTPATLLGLGIYLLIRALKGG